MSRPKTKKPRSSPPETTVGRRVQMNIRVSASLKDWIERLAAQDKRTTNNWCERALAQACERAVREDPRGGRIP